MKKIIYFMLGISLCFCLQAQEKKSKKIFRVEKLNLKVVSYPWADELSLSLRILARSFLENAKLTVSVSYEKSKVTNYFVTVKKRVENNKNMYYAEETIEPINGASQEVLSGNYTIQVFLIVEKQREDVLKKWIEVSGSQRHSIAEKTISFGSKQKIEQDREKIKKFYIQRMINLNNLYKKLRKKERQEFNNSNFTKRRWRDWLYNEYLLKISEEKKTLKLRRERIYYPLYGYTLQKMDTYANLLIRIGKGSSIVLYKRHGLNQEPVGGIDPFAIFKRKDLNQTIESIHRTSARELGISLQKELGYIPPPR